MLSILNTYKNYILIGLFITSLIGTWHVAARYTSAGYEKEKSELVARASKELADEQERSTITGRKVAEAQLKVDQLQNEITKRTFRETQKPVYHECYVTDDGLHIIADAIKGRRKPAH